MKNKQTYEIVLTGLGMALVFVATMFIKVPNALDGFQSRRWIHPIIRKLFKSI